MTNLQEEIDLYINGFEEGYFPPMELLARLTEELGELSREVQHVYGMKKKKSKKQSVRLKRKQEICYLCSSVLRTHKELVLKKHLLLFLKNLKNVMQIDGRKRRKRNDD